VTRITIDRYTQFEAIGKGGFSNVYKAYQPDFNRHVAVKVLTLGENRSIDREQFEAECRAMGTVADHPCVVTVHDNGFTNEGFPFIAMQLCEESLVDRMERSATRTLPPTDVLEVGVRIFDALTRAHNSGILHRDLKPQNILFTEYGAVLADFGIASLAGPETEAAWGLSRHYAAPEVINDEPYTVACDIYSLGATLYTALAGRRPFSVNGDNTREQVERRIRFESPPPIDRDDLPDDVEKEILSLLSKHPSDRPASAAAASRRLNRLLDRFDQSLSMLDEADEHLDTTEVRRVDDAVRDDDTPRESKEPSRDPRYKKTTEFIEPAPSKRPSLARGLLGIVIVTGFVIAGLSLRDGGGPPAAPPTPTSQPEPTASVVAIPIPAPPTEVLVQIEGQTAIVSWNGGGATRHRVFVPAGPPVITDLTQVELPLDDPTAPFCVQVTSVNEGGRESARSTLTCSQ
jgi:serine/threonine protein kinase